MVSCKTLENYKIKADSKMECVYCGCHNELYLDIDHKIPKCRGGKDTAENKQITCQMCNKLKGGLTHEEFILYLDLLTKLFKMRRATIEIPFPIIRHPLNLLPIEEKKVKGDLEERDRVTPVQVEGDVE